METNKDKQQRLDAIQAKIADLKKKLRLIDSNLTVGLHSQGESDGQLRPIVYYKNHKWIDTDLEGWKRAKPDLVWFEMGNIYLDEAELFADVLKVYSRFMLANQQLWEVPYYGPRY